MSGPRVRACIGLASTGDPRHGPLLRRIIESATPPTIEGISSGFGDPDLSATDAINAQAAEMNADLIVMGAYGHTRLREMILGGATRDLLKQAPTCLLLAH